MNPGNGIELRDALAQTEKEDGARHVAERKARLLVFGNEDDSRMKRQDRDFLRRR